jgi:hypothetical protein
MSHPLDDDFQALTGRKLSDAPASSSAADEAGSSSSDDDTADEAEPLVTGARVCGSVVPSSMMTIAYCIVRPHTLEAYPRAPAPPTRTERQLGETNVASICHTPPSPRTNGDSSKGGGSRL